jgi:type III restriction enzyme
LQSDISASLSARPRIADEKYFTGKVLKTEAGDVEVTVDLAKDIEFYLIQNGYVDKNRHITTKYHGSKKAGQLADLPPELAIHAEQVYKLIDSVFSEGQLPEIGDDRNSKINPLNANYDKKEFRELWERINRKAAYVVDFETPELINKCVEELDKELHVTSLQYTIQTGVQEEQATYDALKQGDSFKVIDTTTESNKVSIHSAVKYDLIGKLAEQTKLTRKTIATILQTINNAVFDQFKTNPEDFIAKASLLINEQKATVVVEHLAYDAIADTHSMDIFTQDKRKVDLSKTGDILKRHIYDYVFTDSTIEREFVKELDTSAEVVVYAKLPKGFSIPTPVGDYNPDWAISFKEGTVKHIYFVAETKGSMSSMDLRKIEDCKIECAKKFFSKITSEQVKYDVVDSYGKLMELVK